MQYINSQTVLSAFKLWRTRRMQAVLSMLGVVAGVSGLVVVIAVGEGANRELETALGTLGAGSVIVRTDKGGELPAHRQEAARRLLAPLLKQHSAATIQRARAATDTRQIDNVKLIGTDSHYDSLYKLRLHAGRFLSAYDLRSRQAVCVLGWELGRELFPRGQVVGQEVRFGNDWCRVVGWLADNSYRMPQLEGLGVSDVDRVLYLPITTLTGQRDDYPIDELTLQFRDEGHMSAGLDALKRILTLNTDPSVIEFIVPIELLRQKQKLQQLFQYLLLGVAFVLLVVGGTGIMNTMLLNVISRRPEIGLRRALGATRSDIILQFVTESLVVAVAGGVCGVVLGFVVATAVNWFTDWSMLYNSAGAFIGFTVSVVIGVAFGSYPAMQAAAVSPVRSLNEL